MQMAYELVDIKCEFELNGLCEIDSHHEAIIELLTKLYSNMRSHLTGLKHKYLFDFMTFYRLYDR